MGLLCESVCKAWEKVIKNVERNGYPLSSEKTLVFNFMWELKTILPNIKFDFESKVYEEIDNSDKYLDLLIYLTEDCKIALEFKLPKSTEKGGSNQTDTRKNIYKDLLRLNYLVTNQINKIKKAYFLCATNQSAYLNKGNHKKYVEFNVYQGYKLKGGFQHSEFSNLPIINKDLSFNWEKTVIKDNKNIIDGKFAWLIIEI